MARDTVAESQRSAGSLATPKMLEDTRSPSFLEPQGGRVALLALWLLELEKNRSRPLFKPHSLG